MSSRDPRGARRRRDDRPVHDPADAPPSEIARLLYLSQATVKTHVGRILAKLGLRDRVHVVIFAYGHGLIVPR